MMGLSRQVKYWEDSLNGVQLETLIEQWLAEDWRIEQMSCAFSPLNNRIVKCIILTRWAKI